MHLALIDIMLDQCTGPQRLNRIPEPDIITAKPDHVREYSRANETAISITYAVILEAIHRAAADPQAMRNAIDLCSGPGLVSLAIAKHFENTYVTGIDLSEGMVAQAGLNADKHDLSDRVRFMHGNAAALPERVPNSVDLSTFTFAAHHFPTLENVRTVLTEMDRATCADGLVVVADLARLRSRRITDRYVRTLGADYKAKGMPHFYQDFYQSMFASWSESELFTTIPKETRRRWVQSVPRGLPTVQLLIGLPEGRKETFVRSGVPWQASDHPVPKQYRADWHAARWSLALGKKRVRDPLLQPFAATALRTSA